MSEIWVFDDGPREVKYLWLQPKGNYASTNGFWWLWRFWTWVDLNADYGRQNLRSVVEGFRMARSEGVEPQ